MPRLDKLNHLDKCCENDKKTYLDTIDKILLMKDKRKSTIV